MTLATRTELLKLHDAATLARDAAHRAYQVALANRQKDGDTEHAYEALLAANRVRDSIYRLVLATTGS
jgi:hypothetical protein